MALFGKENRDRLDRLERDDVHAHPIAEAPPRIDGEALARDAGQPALPGDANAYLGKGSRVTGKLNFEGTVRVDGQVEGEIAAQDTLVIGESAIVNAQITGSSIIIKGKVTGDITARKRVEIRAPGKLYGNVTTPSLIIQEGVVFEGHCSMGGGEAAKIDRKVTPFPKEEKAADGVALKAHSEAAK
jgi:cytoskeletal protein CcmA (bactofilin family)